MDDYAGPGVPSFGPMASDPLTPEHGVGFVDNRGPQCLCDRDFPYESGGWLSFNAHLRDAKANAEADLLTLRSALTEALRRSQDAWNSALQNSEPGTAYRTLERAVREALSGQAVSPLCTCHWPEPGAYTEGCPVHDRGDAAKADREPAE